MTKKSDQERFSFKEFEEWVESKPHLTLDSVGISAEAATRYRERGLSVYKADEVAVRAGKHPGEIWLEWWDVPWVTDEEYERSGKRFVAEKVCSRCKETKHRRKFGKRTNAKDGLTNECKQCINQRSRERKEEYYG